MATIEEQQEDLAAALKTVNEVHVKHSWFAPALMEKVQLSLAVHGWKEAMECVAQLQQMDANNVLAFAYHGAFQINLILCSISRLCLRQSFSAWAEVASETDLNSEHNRFELKPKRASNAMIKAPSRTAEC